MRALYRAVVTLVNARALTTLRDAERKSPPNVASAGVQRDRIVHNASRPEIDPIYYTDDYPREGCTVVVRFLPEQKYRISVYAPWIDVSGAGYPLESYSPRNIGSLGVAMDAFAKGRHGVEVRREIFRAEREYQSSCGSTTTL